MGKAETAKLFHPCFEDADGGVVEINSEVKINAPNCKRFGTVNEISFGRNGLVMVKVDGMNNRVNSEYVKRHALTDDEKAVTRIIRKTGINVPFDSLSELTKEIVESFGGARG